MGRSDERTSPATDERGRKAEASLRRLLDDTTDAIAIHRDGRLLYVNRAGAALLGYDPDELLGRSPLDFVVPEQRAVVARRMGESYTRPTTSTEIQETYVRRDGALVPTSVIAIPVIWEGRPATIVHLRDLRLQKWLEAQLIAADRLAAVGLLAASIVHEINTPLTYGLASLEALSRHLVELDPARRAEASELLDRAREALERVAAITRDVRMLSKEGAPPSAVELGPVIASCVRMVEPTARDRARIVVRLSPTPPVLARTSHLAQVFLNLLLNAAQAIPPGDAEHNEIAVASAVEGERVVVSIRDTGTGIPPEIRAHVFEPFFTTKGDEGMGLGLSIVRTIVTSLGGTIDVDDGVGRGTSFRVTFPAARVAGPGSS